MKARKPDVILRELEDVEQALRGCGGLSERRIALWEEAVSAGVSAAAVAALSGVSRPAVQQALKRQREGLATGTRQTIRRAKERAS